MPALLPCFQRAGRPYHTVACRSHDVRDEKVRSRPVLEIRGEVRDSRDRGCPPDCDRNRQFPLEQTVLDEEMRNGSMWVGPAGQGFSGKVLVSDGPRREVHAGLGPDRDHMHCHAVSLARKGQHGKRWPVRSKHGGQVGIEFSPVVDGRSTLTWRQTG